tara:strand:- start:53491 stop:60018 length:6528 start_codon:yes stop_codon:yes gene_type:complete
MYKIFHINQEGIKSIYIFKKRDYTTKYKVELTDEDEISKYLNIQDVESYNPDNIFLINDNLYKDDTIDFIKRKCIKSLDEKYGFEQLYMFCFVKSVYNNKQIYDILSQNDSVPITYNRLFQFISNIYNLNISDLDLKKEFYDYNDIISLNLEDKEIFIKTPIGHKFSIIESYPVIINPFDNIIFDDILNSSGDDIVSTQNNSLLMDIGEIELDTIYLCTSDDILEFTKQYNISSIRTDIDSNELLDFGVILKLYFPFLQSKGIIDERTYKDEISTVLEDNINLLNEAFENQNNSISLLRDIYDRRENELEYKYSGIKHITFTLNLNETINIPLEIIFKLLHTSEKSPFIKYNPGKGREKIYRLFADSVSKDGRKIPFLSKPQIIKLRGNLAKNKMVSIHNIIKKKDDLDKDEIFINLNFLENGSIQIEFFSDKIHSIDEVERLIKENSLHHIQTIESFLNKKGYKYVEFNGLNVNNNIVFDDINYEISLLPSSKINLEKYISCLSSIVNIIQPKLKNGIEMRYKRVSYFNKMDAIEAYITKMTNSNMNRIEIIPLLVDNFSLTEKDAENKYLNWLSNIEVEQQMNNNKKLKIKSNPGFGIYINQVPFKNDIIVNIDSINDIKYIKLLKVYIDSILRLSQSITENIDDSIIKSICNFKETDVKNISDIESNVTQNLLQQNDVTIMESKLLFDSPLDDDDGILGLLGEGDDEPDEILLEYDDEEDVKISPESISVSGEKTKKKTPTKTKSKTPSPDSVSPDIMGDLGFDESVSVPKEKTPTKTKSKTPSPDSVSLGDLGFDESVSVPKEKTLSKSKSKTPSPDSVSPDIIGDLGFDESVSVPKEKTLSKSKSKTLTPDSISPDIMGDLGFDESVSVPKEKIPSKTKSKTSSPDSVSPDIIGDLGFDGSISMLNDNTSSNSKKTSSNSSINSESSDIIGDLGFDDSISMLKENETGKDDNEENIENIVFGDEIGSDSDIEGLEFGDDSEDDDSDEDKQTGGNKTESDKDIVGMPIKNPNPFFSRLVDRDPKLFLKRKSGKYNAYSRTCPINVRRQPIILTDEEKERIDREYPGSYTETFKYGSSPDKQHWYICPRYWCLKTNTSMTEEDVKAGKCGGSTKIIPQNATKVPDDAFVYEFNNPKEHTASDGSYIKHYPGFVKKGSHPDGLCIPCCFKSWNSPVQQKMRESCLSGLGDKVESDEKQTEINEYIKGPEKHPLDKNRWGYLPLSIQKILHTDNSKCYSNKGNGIKPFMYCMLRKGVETNKEQSFIACIADLYIEYADKSDKIKEAPSIKEMKNIIIDSITLDEFIKYFNGSLLETFYDKEVEVNVDEYRDTDVYREIEEKDNIPFDKDEYIERLIKSFVNFKKYLNDDNIKIDHTYLWDIIHRPNPNLFPKGINLVILEIPNNDVSDNVEIICPTNNYSSHLFDTKKQTLILMLKNGFYEPIYFYRDEETSIKIMKKFSLYNNKLLGNLKYLLETIKKSYSKCLPMNSISFDKYEFIKNKYLDEIVQIIDKHSKLNIINQVVQYNQKVIGITLILDEIHECFIPIEPSAKDDNLETIYIDDVEWNDLTQTVTTLRDVYKKTKGEIPCNPRFKILEDSLVVGILTETNQIVMLDKPNENILFDDLDEINDDNYIYDDGKLNYLDRNILLNSDSYDKSREKAVKFIELESNYYNAFRNTVRLILNNYEYLDERKEIEEILDDDSLLYNEKIERIREIFIYLLDEYVEFVEINDDVLMSIDNIQTCVNNKKCDVQYCLTSDKNCKLLIPNKHLISKYDNEKIYFYRISDEILRYGLVRKYIFNPKSYLVLDNVDYNLRENEVILLDTILNDNYFDNLEPAYMNKYINNMSSEFVQPRKSVKYSNIIDLTSTNKPKKKIRIVKKNKKSDDIDETIKQDIDDTKIDDDIDDDIDDTIQQDVDDSEVYVKCIKEVRNIVGDWKKYFKDTYKESLLNDTSDCGFITFIQILKDHIPDKDIKIMDVKNILIKEYNALIEKYSETKIIKHIFLDQGKERIKTQILSRKVTLEQAIISSDYYLTNLDWILLSKHFNLPIVLITTTQLNELRGWNIGLKTTFDKDDNKYETFKKFRKMWIINKDKSFKYYYFIRQFGIKRNEVQRYSIIHPEDTIKTDLSDFKDNMELLFNKIYLKRPSFDQYIKNYYPKKRKIVIKKPSQDDA